MWIACDVFRKKVEVLTTTAPAPAPINTCNSPTAPGFQQQPLQYGSFQQQYDPNQQHHFIGYSPSRPMIQQHQFLPSQQYQQPEASQPRLPSPIKLPSRPTTANRSPPQAPLSPSDPARAESDEGAFRKAYFAWHIRKSPGEEKDRTRNIHIEADTSHVDA